MPGLDVVRALGLPDTVRKFTITFEVNCWPIVEAELVVPPRVGESELVTELRRYELVERPPDGG
jgi:hypothetical protein